MWESYIVLTWDSTSEIGETARWSDAEDMPLMMAPFAVWKFEFKSDDDSAGAMTHGTERRPWRLRTEDAKQMLLGLSLCWYCLKLK